MQIFCSKIKIILSNLVDSIGTEIVPVVGNDLVTVKTINNPIFISEATKENGNVIFNESMEIDTLDFVYDYLKSKPPYIIVEFSNSDGHTFIWGSINPVNPVSIAYNLGNNVKTLKLSRRSTNPIT